MMFKYFLVIGIIILAMILFFLVVNCFGERLVEKSHTNRAENLYKRRPHMGIVLFLLVSFVCLITYHIFRFEVNIKSWYYPIIIFSFLWNAFLIFSSMQYRPYVIEKDNRHLLKQFFMVVVVPVYNEDKEAFQQTLKSISNQTLLPRVVYIVEDGSKEEYRQEELVRAWAKDCPFKVIYKYTENAGKRNAQSHAFKDYLNQADLFLTMDSDTVLDERAIEEATIPFIDEKVTSVAGLLLSMNVKKFISKLLSISFPSSFTAGRASASIYNSVAVSCGGLAVYRVNVIKKYLDYYLNQYIFGQRAMFGDDRMLTHYASLLGKTVYQETAIGYTLMPENISHLSRQRIRWWKSFWWGGMFIIRHHSPRYTIWWTIVAQYICQVLYSVVFPLILIINPIKNGEFPWFVLIYMIVLGYIRCVRILDIKNSKGEKYISLVKYILYTPFSTMLNLYLATILSYYGFIMMWRVSTWGTREKVEVGLDHNDMLDETFKDTLAGVTEDNSPAAMMDYNDITKIS